MNLKNLLLLSLFSVSTNAFSQEYTPLYYRKILNVMPVNSDVVIETTYVKPVLEFKTPIEGHTLGALYRGKQEALLFCTAMNHQSVKRGSLKGMEVKKAQTQEVLMVEVTRKGRAIPALVTSDRVKAGYLNPWALTEVTCIDIK